MSDEDFQAGYFVMKELVATLMLEKAELQNALAKAESEIERLRSENNMALVARNAAEDRADEMFNGCQQRDQEIERLRRELAIEKSWVQRYRDAYCKGDTQR
jgi:predicted RNase H-like nuclease (RuvC/YqgF family)